jgi:hypothetical protein
MEKEAQKCGQLVEFSKNKLPKVNFHPMGKCLPNLVTLIARDQDKSQPRPRSPLNYFRQMVLKYSENALILEMTNDSHFVLEIGE